MAYFSYEVKKNFLHINFNIRRIRKISSLKWQFKILRDLVVLSSVCIGLIFGIRYINHQYEASLISKISIHEPQLGLPEKNMNIRAPAAEDSDKLKLEVKDIEDVDDTLGEEDNLEERFDVESEVSLVSWDTLPKDFDRADQEQSEYEELGSGYRESRYGNTTVYRVLMKSEDLPEIKAQLNALLEKYQVTQVDNVKPGMQVPGGIYYNLYVPIKHLKDFVAQVKEDRDVVLYKSRIRSKRNPPGQSKVFIWVKSI